MTNAILAVAPLWILYAIAILAYLLWCRSNTRCVQLTAAALFWLSMTAILLWINQALTITLRWWGIPQ